MKRIIGMEKWHSAGNQGMDNRNTGNCLETSYTILNQQHRHLQVVCKAYGTVEGPGPRASTVTNASNKGSPWQGTRQGRLLMQQFPSSG
jgi:hypothetical protein